MLSNIPASTAARVIGCVEGGYCPEQGIDDVAGATQSSVGDSGLSYGRYHNDVARNSAARETFNEMVDDAVARGDIDAATAQDWKTRAATEKLSSSPNKFSEAELIEIETKVLEPGRNKIDAQDRQQLASVIKEVNETIDGVAASRGSDLGVLDPDHPQYEQAMSLLAAWANISGNLNQMEKYLSGEGTAANYGGAEPPQGPPTLDNIKDYLKEQKHFDEQDPDGDRWRGFESNIDSALDNPAADIDIVIENPPIPRHKPGGIPIPRHKPTQDDVEDAEQQKETKEAAASPIVLDIDGDGIELTTLNDGVYWDIDQDGMAEACAWVTGGDGLLAYDRNSDGFVTDHSELFGTEKDDGFLALSEFDSNGDGVIDANDTTFDDLIVWIDANGDGYSQEGEMHTLDALGITEIDLNAAAVDYEIEGNTITSESTFTINGVEQTVVDAWFDYDNTNSVYAQDYILDVRALHLPLLRGYGDLPDLHISMSLDNGEGGLLKMVEEIAWADLSTLFSAAFDLGSKITDILYSWAGIYGVDPESRGANMDARELAFLEALFGQEDSSQIIYGQDIFAVKNAFNTIYDAFSARLLVQTSGSELFTDVASYNPATGEFEGTFTLDLTAVDNLIDGLALSGDALAETWANLARLVDATVGLEDLSTADYAALNTIVEDSDVSGVLDLDIVWDSVYEYGRVCYRGDDGDNTLAGGDGNDILHGVGGDDTLYGNAGDDTFYGDDGDDHIYGGLGDDLLMGDNGKDYLYGGSGNDTLRGGYGDDVYFYGSGVDTIYETSGVDTIVFDETIALSQISISYSEANPNDLYIYVDGELAIRIEDYLLNKGSMVEYLSFSDGSIVDLSDYTGIKEGTAGDDTLVGNDFVFLPHDILIGLAGDDTLSGGVGNNILSGGDGNDTYLITSGTDVITDTNGTDTVIFGAGLNSTDATYEVDAAGTLHVSFNGTLYASIENQTTLWGSVETLEFDDNVTIQTSSLSIDQNGTSLADTIYGYRYGADTDNTINAGEGNDRVYGYDGDDAIYGEAGNDSIYASSGNDTLDGGLGDDYLDGSTGNDTYIITSGIDRVSDSVGTDLIVFGSAYDQANMTFERSGSYGNDLDIYFNGVLSSTISYQLSSTDAIETLEFSNGATLSLASYTNIHGLETADIISGVDDLYFEDDRIYGYGGNDTLSGGVGEDELYGGLDSDTLNGGAGNDVLYGEAGNDTLDGGAGDDYLDGGAGADTYIYSGGGDTIHDNGLQNETDVISFAAGISASDITLTRVGRYDLQINVNGNNAILVENQFNTSDQVETLLFDGGATLSLLSTSYTIDGTESSETLYGTDISVGSDTINGYAGNDTLCGYSGDDTLDGGSGVDMLLGGSGDDIYLITADGDFVQDESGTDKIVFDASYSINDLELARSGSSNLIISFDGTPALTINNQFDQDDQIETLEFSDGSTFDLSTQSYPMTGDASDNIIHGISYGGDPDDVLSGGDGDDTLYGYLGDDTLNGGDGDDTLYGGDGDDEYYVGAGVDSISDTGGNDTIYLDTGFSSSDMTYERSGLYDLDIYFSGQKKLTLLNHLNSSSALETLTFADSTTVDLGNLAFTIEGTANNETLNGTDVAGSIDEIYGFAGNDTINAKNGDDTLVGGLGVDTLNGGNGSDVYEWSVGDGNDTLNETDGIDQLVLHNVVQDDIRFVRYGWGVRVHVNDEYITINNQLRSDVYQSNAYDYNQVESILLDDGTTIDLLSEISFVGTSGAESLTALNMQGTILEGLEGNDILYGKAGSDTYVWSVGDGNDTISETGGVDQLVLHGVTADDIRFSEYRNFHLRINIGNETIQINNQQKSEYYKNDAYDSYQVESVLLDDGTIIDLTEGLPFVGTANNDTIYATHMDDVLYGMGGNDTLNAYDGNDILVGGAGNDTLNGSNGNDVYEWSVGDGIDYINETDGVDQLALHNVALEDIRFEKYGYNLRVHVNDERIEINGHLQSDHFQSNAYDGKQVESIILDDGYEIDLLNDISFVGTSGAESLTALNLQGTILEGLEGNDILYGKAGGDTYVWSVGDGSDIIAETGGTDQIVIHGATESDLRFVHSSTYHDLYVYVGDDYIKVNKQFYSDNYQDPAYDYYRVESLQLDDGTNIDLTGGLTFTGTASNETMYATHMDDALYGMAGNDTLNANDGDDVLEGGDGSDYLYGGDGDDLLYGGAGVDMLYGQAGTDTFVFEADSAFTSSDNIQDFDLAQNDKLDVSDLLSGYDPLTDAITDFVQITESGSNSYLNVDADGGADNFVQVAYLYNETGLTDEAALETSGNLIAA